MHDWIKDKCELIIDSILAIEEYFQNISNPEDLRAHQNQRQLDAIMMRYR